MLRECASMLRLYVHSMSSRYLRVAESAVTWRNEYVLTINSSCELKVIFNLVDMYYVYNTQATILFSFVAR